MPQDSGNFFTSSTVSWGDLMTDRPANQPVAQSEVSSALSEFVRQHQASTQRNLADEHNDLTFPAPDRAARTTIQSAIDVDNEILRLIRTGQTVPQSVIDQALRLHEATSADARTDRKGDNDAIAQDQRDVQAEQRVIAADNALLRTANITPEMQQMLQQDIASKKGLITNEQQDYANEAGYVKHDVAELAVNDRVARALRGNRGDLVPALEASITSKEQTELDRGEDAGLEPRYTEADFHDNQINKMLLAAVQDPCILADLYRPKHR